MSLILLARCCRVGLVNLDKTVNHTAASLVGKDVNNNIQIKLELIAVNYREPSIDDF